MKQLLAWMAATGLAVAALYAQRVEVDLQRQTTTVRPVTSADLQTVVLGQQRGNQIEAQQRASLAELGNQDPKLRAAVQAVVAALNRRLPTDKAITMEEIAQEFKAVLLVQPAP